MQEPNQRFLHTKNTLAFHYLPTLALSKSGSGLKHLLTLSPPVRAPRFPISSCRLSQSLQSYDISFSIIHIIRVMMRCFQQQFYYTHAQKKCKCLFISAISIHFFKKYSDAHLRAYVNTFLSSPALRGYDARIY